MEKQGSIALAIVAIVAALGFAIVFSTGGEIDSNVGQAIKFTTSKTADLTRGSLVSGLEGKTADLGADSVLEGVTGCADPDGERGYATKTTASQPGFTSKTDVCHATDGKLLEAYCASDRPRRRAYLCENVGMVCDDGACVAPMAEVVPIPTWVLPRNNDLTGNRICADAGFSRCLAAEEMRERRYYGKINGDCDLFGNAFLQLEDLGTRTVSCTVRPFGSRNCIPYPDANLRFDRSPRMGDHKDFSYIRGAWCY